MGHPLFIRGGMLGRSAGGGAVDNDITVLVAADKPDGLPEFLLVHGTQAVVGPHVQMNHGCARFPAGVGIRGNFFRRNGDVRILGLWGDCASEGSCDNNLIHNLRSLLFVVPRTLLVSGPNRFI